MPVPLAPNDRWSLDFISDQFVCGRRFRILAVFDDCTRECLAAIADTSLSGLRVARKLDLLIARRGRPMQNAFIESFNSRLRDELLNETVFTSLAQARVALGCWREDYNGSRPHSQLGWKTPSEFAFAFDPRRDLALRYAKGSALAPAANPVRESNPYARSELTTG